MTHGEWDTPIGTWIYIPPPLSLRVYVCVCLYFVGVS
jgi:hypothetical protein